MIKSCNKCYWSDKCGEPVVCEDYYPLDENVEAQTAELEYECDLRMREEEYRKIINQFT